MAIVKVLYFSSDFNGRVSSRFVVTRERWLGNVFATVAYMHL